jgi:hypothetical protein
VWGDAVPGEGVVVQSRQSPDLNGDGVVDGTDLGIQLSGWSNPGRGDLNGDQVIDGIDLGMLLGAWTP